MKKYARIGYGLGIGTDPGSYALDVNGQLHVSDGSGGEMLMSNSSLLLHSTEVGGTMTLDVAGQVKATGGIYTLQSGTPITIAAAASITLSNVLPVKNGSNWTGSVFGVVTSTTLVSSANQYYQAQYAIVNGVIGGSSVSSATNLLFSISTSNIIISNTTSGGTATSLPVMYNFTLYPAF